MGRLISFITELKVTRRILDHLDKQDPRAPPSKNLDSDSVLREGKLVGQISRRDLLREVLDLISEHPHREQPGLFLSAITDPAENPILRDSPHPSDGSSQHRS